MRLAPWPRLELNDVGVAVARYLGGLETVSSSNNRLRVSGYDIGPPGVPPFCCRSTARARQLYTLRLLASRETIVNRREVRRTLPLCAQKRAYRMLNGKLRRHKTQHLPHSEAFPASEALKRSTVPHQGMAKLPAFHRCRQICAIKYRAVFFTVRYRPQHTGIAF